MRRRPLSRWKSSGGLSLAFIIKYQQSGLSASLSVRAHGRVSSRVDRRFQPRSVRYSLAPPPFRPEISLRTTTATLKDERDFTRLSTSDKSTLAGHFHRGTTWSTWHGWSPALLFVLSAGLASLGQGGKETTERETNDPRRRGKMFPDRRRSKGAYVFLHVVVD